MRRGLIHFFWELYRCLDGPNRFFSLAAGALVESTWANHSLATGANVYKVEVTALDGATKRTYTLTINRAA